MGGRRHRWAAILVIVTALSGCDNVGWGGIQVELKSPPPPPGAQAVQSRDSLEEELPPLPEGPILYVSRREGDRATLLPLAVIQEGGLGSLPQLLAEEGFARRFVEARMPPGAEFVLFSGGSRVGSLEVQGPEMQLDSSLCAPRPRVSGVVELAPSAGSARSFLALAPAPGQVTPRGAYASYSSTYEQRVASINLATALIPQVGAVWPPSLVDARRDLQILQFQGSQEPAIAATFLYRDALRTGPAPSSAYSLFFLASHDGTAYRATYVWYRDYDRDGKGAPRYLAHFDWDRDGSDEVFLEILGESDRWFAVAGARDDGSWGTTFQDPCGRPGSGAAASRE